MKLNRKIVAAVAAVSLLATAGIAGGEYAKSCKHERKGPLQCIAKDLNLTEAQQSEMKGLFKEMRTNAKALHESLKESSPLKEATKNGKFNKNVFLKTLQEHQALQDRLKADYMEHMYNALTEEQKAAFIAEVKDGTIEKCMQKHHRKHPKHHDKDDD